MRREVELGVDAERESGAIRKQIAHGRPLRPASVAQLGHVGNDSVVERQPDVRRAPCDDGRTIGFVSEPAPKRLSAVTGRSVRTFAIP